MKKEEESEKKRLEQKKQIHSISSEQLWEQKKEKIEPLLHIVFRGINDGVLFDSNFTLPDLFFLTGALVKYSSDEFERIEKFYRSGVVKISMKDSIKNSIIEIQENINEMINYAKKYEIIPTDNDNKK